MDTHIVIMAGGIGSRLWPLSTPQMPKQFIDVLGVGKSLIQLTVERFLPVCRADRFWVVTSERYVELVREQLPEIPAEQILAEPEPRNTAPCIAYACWKISKRFPEANIVVTPSDALVLNTEPFTAAIQSALAFTRSCEAIVTVGIAPSRPETGYGYIHAARKMLGETVKVTGFKEKPDLAAAEQYVADGHYFWNAGIFVWKASTITSQIRMHAPQIAEMMDHLEPSLYTSQEEAALREWFPRCEKVSIDYAVMEKSQSIYVIAGDFGWSDLGSWGAVKTHLAADGEGNAAIGSDIRLFGCRNCVVHTASEKTVIIEGLEGYIVSESGGNLLICRLADEQHIKEYSQSSPAAF